MLRVGLTGGIACGKSHVLARLSAAGFRCLDLDRIAHQAMAPGGSAYAEVVAAFGREMLAPDGSIDRKALGALVFADAAARGSLNAIVHPKVRAEEARQARQGGDAPAIVVSDAALLVETGAHLRFDRLVVVHCDEAEQLRRLMDRDGVGEGAARARIAAQMPVADKRRFAHHEIDSSGTREESAAAADRLAEELKATAAGLRPRAPVPLERALGALVHGPRAGARGLDASRLFAEILNAGGIDLERLARLLDPPHPGVWYRAARHPEKGPGPETLAVPLVLWALARGGPDPAFTVAAAASVARLTHDAAPAIADACLQALLVQDVIVDGRVPVELQRRAREAASLATRWSGAAPSERVTERLAESLAVLAVPAQAADAPAPLVELVQRLLAPNGG